MKFKTISGFTLIELMIVVAIIGILSTIAIPAYQNYTLKAKLAEAFSLMSPLQSRMEQYYQDNRLYGTGGNCGIQPMPTSQYFTINCALDNTNGAGQGYLITAAGIAGKDTALFTFTVTDAGVKATTSAPSGWVLSNSCWVRDPGGSC